MNKYDIPEYQKQGPLIQMAPLIDVVFITLILFMCLSVFAQLESEISINVPSAKEGKENVRNPCEIIINLTKEGRVIINEKELTSAALLEMLKKFSALFSNQSVIIRADEKTYHKSVIGVLDACASAGIFCR